MISYNLKTDFDKGHVKIYFIIEMMSLSPQKQRKKKTLSDFFWNSNYKKRIENQLKKKKKPHISANKS